jgi:CrcB protein
MKGIEIILLAAGGIVGTFLRYKIVESQLLFGSLPINVLLVNVIGSFIIGLFVVTSPHWNVDGKYALFVAFGFCGSLTTMSALALDSSNLIENKQFYLMAVNVLANVGLSIGAVFGGKALMAALIS